MQSNAFIVEFKFNTSIAATYFECHEIHSKAITTTNQSNFLGIIFNDSLTIFKKNTQGKNQYVKAGDPLNRSPSNTPLAVS